MSWPRMYVNERGGKRTNMKAVYFYGEDEMLCGEVKSIFSKGNTIRIEINNDVFAFRGVHKDCNMACVFLSELWWEDKPLIISKEHGGIRFIDAETDDEIFVKN